MSTNLQNLVSFRNKIIEAFDKKVTVLVPMSEKANLARSILASGISQFTIVPVNSGDPNKFAFKVFISGHLSGEMLDLDRDYYSDPYMGNVLDNKPGTASRDKDFDVDDDDNGCMLDGDDDSDNF